MRNEWAHSTHWLIETNVTWLVSFIFLVGEIFACTSTCRLRTSTRFWCVVSNEMLPSMCCRPQYANGYAFQLENVCANAEHSNGWKIAGKTLCVCVCVWRREYRGSQQRAGRHTKERCAQTRFHSHARCIRCDTKFHSRERSDNARNIETMEMSLFGKSCALLPRNEARPYINKCKATLSIVSPPYSQSVSECAHSMYHFDALWMMRRNRCVRRRLTQASTLTLSLRSMGKFSFTLR